LLFPQDEIRNLATNPFRKVLFLLSVAGSNRADIFCECYKIDVFDR